VLLNMLAARVKGLRLLLNILGTARHMLNTPSNTLSCSTLSSQLVRLKKTLVLLRLVLQLLSLKALQLAMTPNAKRSSLVIAM